MENGLYHKKVAWKDEFENEIIEKMFSSGFNIIYTRHIEDKIIDREIDKNKISLKTLSCGEVFEVRIEDDEVKKFVARCKYNEDNDICIVVLLVDNRLLIKTCWLNSIKDIHKTLNSSKYIRNIG